MFKQMLAVGLLGVSAMANAQAPAADVNKQVSMCMVVVTYHAWRGDVQKRPADTQWVQTAIVKLRDVVQRNNVQLESVQPQSTVLVQQLSDALKSNNEKTVNDLLSTARLGCQPTGILENEP